MTDHIRVLQEQLQANPDDAEAFGVLEAHFTDAKDWRQLRAIYVERSQSGQKTDFAALAEKLAAIAEGLDKAQPVIRGLRLAQTREFIVLRPVEA
ncbi:MAG: hypothetical protein ACNA8W_22830, partial [Bradymonadaceae bacterium]